MQRHPVEEARKILVEGIAPGPRTNPCVCGAGQYAHTGKRATGPCKATNCARYRPDRAWVLAYAALDAQDATLGDAMRAADAILYAKHRKARPSEPGKWRIGVSDVDTCPKAIEYRNRPPEDFVPDWEDKREALVGTIIHEGVEARMRLAYPWRLFEQWIEIPGLDRDGRYDWYDPIIAQVGDTKTAGDWRWDRVGEHGPDEDTWGKVMLYGLALEEQGYPVETVRLDYIKRANGHDEPFVRPYDRKVAERARDRLLGYATALDLGLPLERKGEGPDRDPLCKRCFARSHCWSIEKARSVGRSPYSFTILGEDPETDAIAAAIGRMVAARTVARTAKDDQEREKDLLDGIEPGRYGDFEGYAKGGGGGADWQRYAQMLADYYDMPEDERPLLSAIEMPQKKRYTFVQWGRVRKATLDKEAKARKAAEQEGAKV